MTRIALVLGGIYSHIELIKALRERCYYTILVDYNDYPKAKEFADEHIQESIYDFLFLEKIIKERNVKAVFSSNLDRTLPVIARLSSIFEIPFYLDYKTSILVTDKIKMKSVLENNKINIAKWKLIGDYKDVLKTKYRYPIIFKHVSGTGSLGLQKANKPDDIEKSFQNCINETSDDEIIVEEFIEGKEYSLDCFVFENKTNVYTIRERLKLFVKETNSVVCVGCLVVNNMLDAKTKSSFKELSTRVANSFGLENSPLLVQLINHEILGPIVVEVAARNSGGNAQDLIKIIFKRDLVNWSIDAILGNKQNDNEPLPLVKYFYMSALIYAKGGILGECSGFDICLNKQIIESYYLIRSIGDKIPEKVSVKNRVAEVIIKADSIGGLKKKIFELYKTIDVEDINGKSILSYDYSILKTEI